MTQTNHKLTNFSVNKSLDKKIYCLDKKNLKHKCDKY